MKIYKYQIYSYKCKIEMPAGSKILALQIREGIPCIWALVNPKKHPVIRTFITYITGEEVSLTDDYIGTYQIGWYVGHVFEVKS